MARTEAQKEADRRYAQKIQNTGKYMRFSTTLPTEEAEALNATLETAGMSKADFIRKAFEHLKAGTL